MRQNSQSRCRVLVLQPPAAGWQFLQLPLLLAALLLAMLLCNLHPSAVHAADAHPSHMAAAGMANCEINKGACTLKNGAAVVTLDILPKPVKAMQDLSFTVTLPGQQSYPGLKLDLQMIGMDMGTNQVPLTRTADGRYTGTGVIPRCHSGKKLWSATVTIPGQPFETSFLFNVL